MSKARNDFMYIEKETFWFTAVTLSFGLFVLLVVGIVTAWSLTIGLGVRMVEIVLKLPNRAKRAQLLLIIGTGLFAVGALGFIAGYLSQGQTSMLCVVSLILTGVGSSVKRVKYQ